MKTGKLLGYPMAMSAHHLYSVTYVALASSLDSILDGRVGLLKSL